MLLCAVRRSTRPQAVLASLRRARSLSRFSSCIHRELKEPHRVTGFGRSRIQHPSAWDTRQRFLHTGQVFKGKVVSFDLPDVGEGIQTVEIKEWFVGVGDTVSMGDPVCEAQSDKSAATIHVPHDGVIKELMYEVGDTATKGKPLLMMEVEGEDVEAPPTEDTPPSPLSSSDDIQTTPAVRKLADDNSVDLREVLGTGKNGRILKEDVMNIVESVSTKVSDILAAVKLPDSLEGSSSKVFATPAVRHMAKERGVNLDEVQGTGESGRVLKEDLLRHIENATKVQATPTATPPVMVAPKEDWTESIQGFKSVMVKTMTLSGQIPQFGYCDEVDMSRLVSLRSSLKEQVEEKGMRFSYMPVLVKAVSMALSEHPMLNAIVNHDCTAITYKADHNIGIAMDTPAGLVVPNIKQVQKMSIREITLELNRLHDLGLKAKLGPADITGGTFSLSNIGVIGGTYTRPLCLPPEVAIGAFGKVSILPRFNSSGDLYSAHVMQASWSADHRVIDGATVARFSNKWKTLVEEPAGMIMELR